MKKAFKYVLILTLVLMMAGMFTACGAASDSIAKPVADQDEAGNAKSVEITGACTLTQLDANTLRVACTTNLEDGVVVRISIDSYNGEVIDSVVRTKQGDSFYHDFAIEQGWNFPIYGNVVCVPSEYGSQPKEITQAYGKTFGNLTGDCVVWNSQGNAVVLQSAPLEKIDA